MRRRLVAASLAVVALSGCRGTTPASHEGLGTSASHRRGATALDARGGFPTEDGAELARDEADLSRAVEAYRFFYPTVSCAALLDGYEAVGLVANQRFGVLEAQPRHAMLTASADTPYGAIELDLAEGPMIVEVPAGPLLVVAIDIHQRGVADMGLAGPDEGRGGRYVIVPPGHTGRIPSHLRRADASSNRVFVDVRSLPVNGDVRGAIERLRQVKVRPLRPPPGREEPTWIDLSEQPTQVTAVPYETTIQFWEALDEVLDREPTYEPYRIAYGRLAALGLVKGQPFAPDARMRRILEEAARRGHAEMRSAAFADTRPDRVVWPGRRWEWVALVADAGEFVSDSFVDLHAREKWFFLAVGASPATFRRRAGTGVLSWLAARDGSGAYLDGSHTYKLTIPSSVPAKTFWSVTAYDAETRSQVVTEQARAALRSYVELRDAPQNEPLELYFGPTEPAGHANRWIRTVPGRGWFAYFRVYAPESAALDGSWQPGDLTRVE